MLLKIRIAEYNDLDSINELLYVSKSYWGYDKLFLDQYMKIFRFTNEYLNKNTVKMLYIRSVFSGFYSFIVSKDGLLELDSFFLHPYCIGKGFGRQLWDICCQDARNLGKSEFIILSEPNAKRFYLKMGCIEIGERQSLIKSNHFQPILEYKILTLQNMKSEDIA